MVSQCIKYWFAVICKHEAVTFIHNNWLKTKYVCFIVVNACPGVILFLEPFQNDPTPLSFHQNPLAIYSQHCMLRYIEEGTSYLPCFPSTHEHHKANQLCDYKMILT